MGGVRILHQNWTNTWLAVITDESIEGSGKVKADLDNIMVYFSDMIKLVGSTDSSVITPDEHQDPIDAWME